MNPSNHREQKGEEVLLTLTYDQQGTACGLPVCAVDKAPTFNMPDYVPAEVMDLKPELETLCARLNAMSRRWYYPPFPTLLLPCCLPCICCYFGMDSKRTSKMKAMVAEWNLSAGRVHGVSLQWNYGFALLDREHTSMETDMFPPGLDLVKNTKAEGKKEAGEQEELKNILKSHIVNNNHEDLSDAKPCAV